VEDINVVKILLIYPAGTGLESRRDHHYLLHESL